MTVIIVVAVVGAVVGAMAAAYSIGYRRGHRTGHARGWRAHLYIVERGEHPYLGMGLTPGDFGR